DQPELGVDGRIVLWRSSPRQAYLRPKIQILGPHLIVPATGGRPIIQRRFASASGRHRQIAGLLGFETSKPNHN
ncbi:hypothetical protein DRO64_03910, partial [Candidatus Bathyarchaeota archaeon]